MIKQIVFAFLLILFNSFGAISQNAGLEEVQLKLESYFKNFPLEKLYVHTDKSFYTTGEILWFKIYRCNDSLTRGTIRDKVAYVDILDDKHVPVLRTKIEMNEKDGNGSLELPLALASGNYTLRAYTNWMKNFGAEYFFEKKITLVNPFKTIEAIKDTSLLSSIDLFPEGGNLVSGILSQIAFRVNNGKNQTGKGFLLDENSDTISRFTPYKFGLGSFYFTPDIKHQYKAIFIFDDNSFVTRSLPQIFDKGYVMSVDADNQKINVTVHTNEPSASEIFLIGQSHQKIRVAKRNKVSDGVCIISINKSDLEPGVSQVTVFNQNKQPVCERLVFIIPSQKDVLTTSLSKQIFDNREKVSLSISSSTSSSAGLSVSVYQFDSLQTNDKHDITSYIWLESELKGRIENPEYYLSGTSDEIKKAADHLMLTYGWRKFDWNKVFSAPAAIKFFPESSGHTITCRVTNTATGNPVKKINVFLSIPQTSYKLFSAISDDSGMVHFRTNEFFGRAEIFLQAARRNDSLKIELINPYFEQFTNHSYAPFTIAADKKTLLENYSINMQSQHIYSGDSIQKSAAPSIKDTFPFYGQPQNFYLLDDYTRFTTMEEVLREYVREVNVGVKGSGNLKFKLLNENNQGYYTDNILVMIDGVPVPDPDKIFSVDPLKIRRIDIIPRSYLLGNLFFYGLANFSTYLENHEGIDIDSKAIVLDYEGLQIKREFYSPDYSGQERFTSRIPDLRNTLYWSPDVHFDKPIQFYTGDNKGRYIVVIEGISNEGQPLKAVSEFEVK